MRGDFSRFTFDPLDRYSRVLLQQGRVLLDADWNEQNAILLRIARTLGADLIGEHGGPSSHCAFAMIRRDELDDRLSDEDRARLERRGLLPLGERDILLAPGHYYVDGWLTALEDYSSYEHQRFLPDPPGVGEDGPWLLYLDVWEHHVSALEDAELMEPALGGPDTATRAQVAWQVRVLGGEALTDRGWFRAWREAGAGCASFPLNDFRVDLQGRRPRLRAWASEPPEDDDPCVMPAGSRYRGHENQLYRVEIHGVDSDGRATFKWSRENGSVVASWRSTEGSDLILSGLRDVARGVGSGDWLELDPRGDLDMRGRPGAMVRVVAVDGERVTVEPPEGGTGPSAPMPGATARRWDQRSTRNRSLIGGVVPVTEGDTEDAWIELEDGVRIQFQAAPNGEASRYRTGDYWLIPARVGSGDVLWPREEHVEPDGSTSVHPVARPPHGIEHHLAPLWFVRDGDDAGPLDLRRTFRALATCEEG